MSEGMFRQSLAWAMAIDTMAEKEKEKERVRANTQSNDIVSLDYSFLQEDDF